MTTRTRRAIAFSTLVAGALTFGAVEARAQATDCDALMKQAVTAGAAPGVTINPATGSVRMDVGGAYCEEPIEKWSTRDINVGEIKQNANKDNPAADAEDGSGAAGIGMRGTATKRPGQTCRRELVDLYQGKFRRVGNRYYWLARVVALDVDNNGKTDNLAFTLTRRSPPETRYVYYFPAGEGPFARDLPDLKLAKDSWIPSVCLGDVVFRQPPDATPPPDDPEPKVETEAEPKTAKPEAEPAPKVDRPPLIVGPAPEEESSIMMWVGAGAGVFVLLGAGVGAFLWLRRRKAAKAAVPEDGEEEAEES